MCAVPASVGVVSGFVRNIQDGGQRCGQKRNVGGVSFEANFNQLG
jgi:hypothetical protein